MKIKVGDNVIVIAGKDKGNIGTVSEIIPAKNKIIIEGINFQTKHVKPTQQQPEGGIEKNEGPIHVSNVMLNVGDTKDASKAKVSRVKIEKHQKQNGRSQKVRIAKATGEEV